MRALLMTAICAFCMGPSSGVAQERAAIGDGRLFTNDFFGDLHDRWRTGSYVYSHLRGRQMHDGTDRAFGDVIEYRLRGEIIAPAYGRGGDGSRPYVGALSMGAHTHYGDGGTQSSFGIDLTAIGPQTRLDRFQESFHDAFSLPMPSRAEQLDDAFFWSATAAVTETVRLADNVTFRPFAEAQLGVEDTVRIGGDVLIGYVGQTDLMLRDVVTGQLYRGTQSPGSGATFVIGADIAAVGGSVYLPEDSGYIASPTRTRARAGAHYQFSQDVTVFYGVTYLSKEFEGQPEGQFVGSLKLNFNF